MLPRSGGEKEYLDYGEILEPNMTCEIRKMGKMILIKSIFFSFRVPKTQDTGTVYVLPDTLLFDETG